MCGIIGITCEDGELTAILMEEFLIQSQIRGKHATGIAYIEDGDIIKMIQPVPAKEFVKNHEMSHSTMMLGHTRYSTSDIKYNQPIGNNDLAIVHNGVITQEAFPDWEKHFKYNDFKTRNDTELLLKCIDNEENPFFKFINASIACGLLYKDMMCCMRNNTRPLYLFKSDHFSGFASTEDIIKRTSKNLGIDMEIEKTQPFRQYCFSDKNENMVSFEVEHNKTMLFAKDQQ